MRTNVMPLISGSHPKARTLERVCMRRSSLEVALVVDDGLDLLGGEDVQEAGHAARSLSLLTVLLALLRTLLDEIDLIGSTGELAHFRAAGEVRSHGTAAGELRPAVGPGFGVASSAV